MRIAMIGHKRIPSRSGGVEVAVEELSWRMVQKGKMVDLYNRSTGEDRYSSYNGCRIYEVRTFANPKLNALVYAFFATIRACFKSYDVIHYHAEGPAAMLWLAKLFRKKCVVTIHGLDWQREKWGFFATRFLLFGEKMAAAYADEIIVLSQNTKQYFLDTYHRETVYIPNGIGAFPRIGDDVLAPLGIQKHRYLLFLARITAEKGLHELLMAYAQLETDMPLIIAGDFSSATDYTRQIQKLAAADNRVKLIGFVSGMLWDALYTNCYLYILPSHVEGMPLSLLEAIGHGARCLTSDIPENKEVAEDYVHFFKAGDEASLKYVLETLLSRQAEHDTNFGRTHSLSETEQCIDAIIKRYDWNTITDSTLAVYNKVIHKDERKYT